MKDKQPSKRNLRKGVLRRLEERVDLPRLDYKRRNHKGGSQAKVVGIISATVLYMVIFGLVYVSWAKGNIDDLTMNKVSWIMIIPATLIGALVWLIAANRKEYPVREDIRAHIIDFEGEDGMLWRFEPALQHIKIKKVSMEVLIDASRCRELEKMAPEDVCAAIHALHAYLQNEAKPTVFNAIEANFASEAAAA